MHKEASKNIGARKAWQALLAALLIACGLAVASVSPMMAQKAEAYDSSMTIRTDFGPNSPLIGKHLNWDRYVWYDGKLVSEPEWYWRTHNAPAPNQHYKTNTLTVDSIPSQTYTGQAITIPNLVVRVGSKTLSKSQYEVTYKNNTDAGIATVTVKGKGAYAPTRTKGKNGDTDTITSWVGVGTFVIEPTCPKLSDASISVQSTVPYDYTAAGGCKPDITVQLAGRKLVEGQDYGCVYQNNKGVGTATVSIVGKCTNTTGYYGQINRSYQIVPSESIEDADITIANCTYNGKAQTPKPVVKIGDRRLTEGEDYTLTDYKNNFNRGTASVTIVGKNYSGSVTKNFTIRGQQGNLRVGYADPIAGYHLTSFWNTTTSGGTSSSSSHCLEALGTGTISYEILSGPEWLSVQRGKSSVRRTDSIGNLVGQFWYADFTASLGAEPGTYPVSVRITSEGTYCYEPVSQDVTFTVIVSSTQMSKCAVSLSTQQVSYTGAEQEPTVTAALGSLPLTEGTDYEVEYENNVKVGKATVKVVGSDGLCTGEAVRSFSIAATSLSRLSSSDLSGLADAAYTGAAIAPKPVVTLDGRTLVEKTDYTLAYKNNTKVGQASITIAGKGNYRDSKTLTFKITPSNPISDADVDPMAPLKYNGKEQKPKPVVYYGGVKLKENTDYTLSWKDNREIGVATVTITGKTFAGTKDVHFDIVNQLGKLTASAAAKTVKLSAVQSGAIAVRDAVKASGATGEISFAKAAGSEYLTVDAATGAVVVAQGTPVGVYEFAVDVTSAANGEYSAITKRVRAKIEVKDQALLADLSKAVVWDLPASVEWDGTAKTPEPTVTLDYRVLAKGVDYTLEYAKNTAVGTATVKMTGIGAYKGSKSATFKIAKPSLASLTAADVSGLSDALYMGKAITPAISVTYNGKPLAEKTDYTLSYKNNVNVGTATVTVTGKGSYAGSKAFNFDIAPAESIEGAEVVSIADVKYTGKALKPSPTVKLGDKTLKANTDYTLVYTDNIQIGQATVTIVGKNYSGEKVAHFNIVKTLGKLTVSAKGQTVRQGALLNGAASLDTALKVTAATGPVTFGKASGADCLSVDSQTGVITVAADAEPGAHSISVDVTSAANGDYGAVAKQVTVKVTVVALSYKLGEATITGLPASVEYTGAAQVPAATVVLDGRTLVEGTDYRIEYTKNTAAGAATVKATGIGSFTGSKSATFKITKPSLANLTEADVSGLGDMAYTGKALKPEPTVTYNGRTLVKNTDYTLSYKNNTKIGTATVTIAGKGNYAGSKGFTFSIVSAGLLAAGSAR